VAAPLLVTRNTLYIDPQSRDCRFLCLLELSDGSTFHYTGKRVEYGLQDGIDAAPGQGPYDADFAAAQFPGVYGLDNTQLLSLPREGCTGLWRCGRATRLS
jgi:hypothetical protein